MSANIQKRPHDPRGIAPHEDRIFRNVGRAEITGSGNLTFVAQIHPAARKLHAAFLLIYLPINLNRAADETAISILQSIDVDVHPEPLVRLFLLYRPVDGRGIENPNHNDVRSS